MVVTAARSSRTRTIGMPAETTALGSTTPGTGVVAMSATPMRAPSRPAVTTHSSVA